MDGAPLWECVNSKKYHKCVFALYNECYCNDANKPDKTRNHQAATTDKDNDVTVYNYSSGLEPNTDKLAFAKEYLESRIWKGNTIYMRCNAYFRSIDKIRSQLIKSEVFF